MPQANARASVSQGPGPSLCGPNHAPRLVPSGVWGGTGTGHGVDYLTLLRRASGQGMHIAIRGRSYVPAAAHVSPTSGAGALCPLQCRPFPQGGSHGPYNNEELAIGEKRVYVAAACPDPVMASGSRPVVIIEAGQSAPHGISMCLSTSRYVLSVCRQTSHLTRSDLRSRPMGFRRVCCR